MRRNGSVHVHVGQSKRWQSNEMVGRCFNDVGVLKPLTLTEFVQYKFRLSLIVIDSLNLQIKLFCLKSFLNPRRVVVKRAKTST